MHETGPFFLSLGHFVELFFNVGREVVVHYLGEVLVEEIGDHNAHVGGEQLVSLCSGYFGFCCFSYVSAFEGYYVVLAFRPFLVAAGYILALLYGAYDWGVGRRTSYSEFLHFVNQSCFVVARRVLRETLCGRYFFGLGAVVFFYCRQRAVFAVGVFVVMRFAINAQETVEFYYLARGCKLFLVPFY